MKIRHGFVSNSSASSFIVKESEKQKAEEYGLKLVSVSKLISILNRIRGVEEELFDLDMEFVSDYLGYSCVKDRIDDLEKIKDCYISTPFDRDMAFEMGINYPAYEGDL